MAESKSKKEKEAKKMRRNVPAGENTKGLKQVLADTKNQDLTVDEFVSLISPYSGDKGAMLSKVMTDELSAFRRMVIKIYDTMTQDVSDVLANEQMDLAKMYDERHHILVERILKQIQELRDIYPHFSFDDYYMDPEGYLAKIYKSTPMPDEDEMESGRRHIAYHRLQWLRSEGERLQAENNKLQKRLNQIKRGQREDLKRAVQQEVAAEQTNIELVQQEHVMQEKLDDLNQSLQETIVEEEVKQVQAKKLAVKKKLKKKRTREKPVWEDIAPVEDWNVTAAAEIETSHLVEHVEHEMSRLSVTASASLRSPLSTSRLNSPEVTMRQEVVQQLRQSSPGRQRSPQGAQALSPSRLGGSALSPSRQSSARQAPQFESTRIQAPRMRRTAGPRDTWGGFG